MVLGRGKSIRRRIGSSGPTTAELPILLIINLFVDHTFDIITLSEGIESTEETITGNILFSIIAHQFQGDRILFGKLLESLNPKEQ